MPSLLSLVPFVGLALSGVTADKDDSYYRPGSGNPNVYETMYWEDSTNILEDLSSFQSLYVEFHHCAWTQMRWDEDDEGEVDENDYWYMGKVPPFGANVAFSLYGALKGQSFSGCNSKTFINSFYTNKGYEAFSNAMYYSGMSGFSYFGDDDSHSYSSTCGGGYGVGCDYSNGFALHKYSTDDCNPAYYSGVSDRMYNLNSAMNKAQCVQIYDAYKYQGYISGTPLELLGYSNSCFYQNYWSPDGQCPDPHGRIQYYQQNFNKGVKKSQKQEPFTAYKKDIKQAKTMFWIGGLCFAGAFCLLIWGPIAALFSKAKFVTTSAATAPTTIDKTDEVSRVSKIPAMMEENGDEDSVMVSRPPSMPNKEPSPQKRRGSLANKVRGVFSKK